MKKRGLVLFVAVVLVILWGCQQRIEPSIPESGTRFYYKTPGEKLKNDRTAIKFEERDISEFETDYAQVFETYLKGPEDSALESPFPKSVQLVSAKMIGTQLNLMLSENYADLSGVDLTLACTCITLTGLELPGVESVAIRAQSRTLNGKWEIVMNQDKFLTEDLGASLISTSYALYFSDTDNRYLIGSPIRVDREEQNPAAYLVQKLIDGPSESGLAETMPLGTELIGMEITDGICNVNFTKEFLDGTPRTVLAQRMTILSLTNTLTQLDEISALAISVEGELLTDYGMMDLRQPLTFEKKAIGPARTALNELDANLYLTIGQRSTLSPLPIRMKQTASDVPVELLLQELLAYKDQNGYHSPIPSGTKLLSVHKEKDIYYIDLSSEFLSQQDAAKLSLAVRSICSTVLALDQDAMACITVEGATPEGNHSSLFAPVPWTPQWINQ